MLARLSQERIRREIRHSAQSVQSNIFVLKLGPLSKNDNRIRAIGDEISKIVTNSDVAHLEFQWRFWHLWIRRSATPEPDHRVLYEVLGMPAEIMRPVQAWGKTQPNSD